MTRTWAARQVYKKRYIRRDKKRTGKRAGEPRPDTVETVLRELDDARARAGLTKEALALKAGLPAPTVRKLFTSLTASPTLRTVSRLAGPLGLRIALLRTDAGAAAESEEVPKAAEGEGHSSPSPAALGPGGDDAEG